MTSGHKKPSFPFAITCLLLIIGLIAGGIMFFKLQLALLMMSGWVVCAIMGKFLGYTYEDLEAGAFELIQKAMGACIILVCVGALIGAWISAGTVPVMIYAGLKIISPSIFLVTSLIVCSLTSIFTGTSWGTIGTVGVALMGIGAGLGFDPGMTAATIICGSFFGDKMSPLSDTTNMAAAVTGTPLFRHIRHMWFTITPAYVVTFIIYLFIGFKQTPEAMAPDQINAILDGLSQHFNLGVGAVIPMLLVLVMLLKRCSPILSIAGALWGVIVAVLCNGIEVTAAFNSMWGGFKGDFTDAPMLAKLLNRGGVTSMLNIMCLVVLACGLGGMLRRMGVIDVALEPLAKWANSGFKLVLSTLIVGYGTLMLTAAIYFSIVMTGTLMAPVFRPQGFRSENCSRVVEDASTLGGPLVPWANNALFPMATLGVAYLDYIPYVYLLFLTPCFSLLYGLFNITMTRLSPEEVEEERKEREGLAA
ncbi:MAG: Na+/H+ antiporter NhaC [Bilophila sp.]